MLPSLHFLMNVLQGEAAALDALPSRGHWGLILVIWRSSSPCRRHTRTALSSPGSRSTAPMQNWPARS
jgi:hypothetical protein